MIDISAHLPILVILIPLISAVIIPVVGQINRLFSWYIAVGVTFITFLISFELLINVQNLGSISYWLGGWKPPWGIEYVLDYLNAYILLIISFIAFIVALYAKKSIQKEIEEHKITIFYSVYMLFVTGLMGIVLTGDLFNLYVFIEISSLSAYTLVAVGRKREALIASYNYLILGTIAATFILLGIGYLYMMTGTLNIADLREKLIVHYGSNVIVTAFAFFTVGISLKLALFPLHIWLPNAYTNAPSVVSTIMAATSTKVGAYILLRTMFTIFTVEFDLQSIHVTKILLVLSSVAIIVGSVMAISQTNIKRMLAYSSVGQIGYIVLGAALLNEIAMIGSLIHILNHAIMKGTLFLVVGMIVYKTGIENIAGLKGMGKKMPYSMAAFTIASLSMIGVPLTVGFVSKWYISIGAINADRWYLVLVILFSSLLTAIYFWRIIENIYFKKADSEIQNVDQSTQLIKPSKDYDMKLQAFKQDDAPLGMLLPTLLLAGLCIIFGIAAFVPISLAEKAAIMLLGGI